MKTLTFEVSETVKTWYSREIMVTEDDVRAHLLKYIEEHQGSDVLRQWGEDALANFVDDPDHEAWNEVAWEKFEANRNDKEDEVESETCDSEASIIERGGWDDNEES